MDDYCVASTAGSSKVQTVMGVVQLTNDVPISHLQKKSLQNLTRPFVGASNFYVLLADRL